MKPLKILALLIVVAFLASACSQNHYAKSKRKMTQHQGQLAPVADKQ